MESSDECEKHVKGFSGAVYKSFPSRYLAEGWLRELLTADLEKENIRLSELYPDSDENSNNDVMSEGSGPDVEAEVGYKNSIPLNYPSLDKITSLQDPGARAQEKPIHTAFSPPSAPDDTILVPIQQIGDENQPPAIPLSPQQERVLNEVLEGHNVFFTGPAGSGKTLILEHIKYQLEKRGKIVATTAPTGAAADLIKGQTIYSWSRVGKGDKGVLEYVGEARGRQTISQTSVSAWNNVQVLIVDEVSMVGHYSARGPKGTDCWLRYDGYPFCVIVVSGFIRKIE